MAQITQRKTERLAHGQLAAAKTTIYICHPDTRVKITCISLTNTDAAVRTANLYLKENGGTSRLITPSDLSLGISFQWIDKDLSHAMHPGDEIEGDASVATQIDYVLSGETY